MGFEWAEEEVACNLCGASDSTVLFTNDSHGFGLRTVICRRCSLIYLNPRPSEEDYRRFYHQAYHRLFPRRALFSDQRTPESFASASARRRLDWYGRFLQPGLRLLEIGPGEGAFLSELRARCSASQLLGIDPTPEEVAACRRKNLDVRLGYLSDLPDEINGFSHIAAFHVLEHSLDPAGLLRAIAARLCPSGVLFAEVPNILGSWRGLGMIHVAHPYQFSPATLRFALERSGFEVLELEALEGHPFESSLRVVGAKTAASESSRPIALPQVDVPLVQQRFKERLRWWRYDLALSHLKRLAFRILGQRFSGVLWDRTVGLKWRMVALGAPRRANEKP